jgi:hypothetical protein
MKPHKYPEQTNTNAMGLFTLSLRAPQGRGNLLGLLRRFTPRKDTLLNAFVLNQISMAAQYASLTALERNRGCKQSPTL